MSFLLRSSRALVRDWRHQSRGEGIVSEGKGNGKGKERRRKGKKRRMNGEQIEKLHILRSAVEDSRPFVPLRGNESVDVGLF